MRVARTVRARTGARYPACVRLLVLTAGVIAAVPALVWVLVSDGSTQEFWLQTAMSIAIFWLTWRLLATRERQEATREAKFFLSLVTAVMRDRSEEMLAALDRDLERGGPCRRTAVLGTIAPMIAAEILRVLAQVAAPEGATVAAYACDISTDATPAQAALRQAVTAQLNGDRAAAWDVLAALHEVGGCAAVRAMVICAVELCAALETQRLRPVD